MVRLRLPCLVIIATVVAMVASACSGSSDDLEQAASPVPTTTPESFDQGRIDLTRELRVGLVTDAGGLNDQGFNATAHRGLQRAIFDFEVDGQVLESRTADDYIPNLTEFAEAGYDLVISVGPSMADATRSVAEGYAQTEFAILDFDYPLAERLPNVQGIVFNEPEAGYVAGYLAALATETGTIAGVGPAEGNSADRYFSGFERGAKEANRRVEVLRLGVEGEADGIACRDLSEAAITNNADVVFPLAPDCATGALEVAKQRRVWGIGVDVDQSYLGEHVLTSAVKRMDVAVWDTVQAAISGVIEDAIGTMSPYRLKGGDVVVYGMSYGGIGLGPVSSDLSPSVLAQVDDVVEAIVEGSLEISPS